MPSLAVDQLDDYVSFVRRAEKDDGTGTLDQTPTVILQDVPARVRAMSGRERDRGFHTETRANYVVKVRNDELIRQVTENDFVRWGSEELTIRFIPDDGPRPMFINIECERGAPVPQ